MRIGHWNYAHATKLAFQQMDRIRQWRGVVLDSLGFAPRECAFQVMHDEAGLRLRRYHDGTRSGTYGEAQDGPPILIVPAPIKRAYIWDLAPKVSVVRRCQERGMQVWLAEWRHPEHDRPTGHLGLADYADRLIGKCIDAICADLGRQPVILAGHSLGGTLAAVFSCLHPERVRGLVLLESPLHFGKDAGKLHSAVASSPHVGFIGESFGNVPGSFLNVASVASAPSEFHWQRLADFSACVSDREALATHMRVERWMHDEFPLPGRLFTDIVELLYRNDLLMQGRLRLSGRTIGPRDMTVPLLSVVDARSTIIPPESVIPFHQAAAGCPKKLLNYDGDIGIAIQHVGTLVGASAHARLWPDICDWLAEVQGTA